jgi:hypothetical protein
MKLTACTVVPNSPAILAGTGITMRTDRLVSAASFSR